MKISLMKKYPHSHSVQMGGVRVKDFNNAKTEKRGSNNEWSAAHAKETAAVVPVTVEPIEVELTLAVVVPQHRDITVQVDLGDRAKTDDRVFPLLFGIDFPEGEDVANLARVVAVFFHQMNGFFGRDVAVEVEELPLPLADLVGGDGESLLRQVAIRPAVVTGAYAIFESEVGADGHKLLDIRQRYDHLAAGRQELNLELAGQDLANLVFATDLFDQSIEFTGSQIFGCKIAHRILLGLCCPLESSPHPETLDSGNFHHSF